MSNVATAQNATTEEKKKTIPKIEVEEPLPFDANIKCCFINTIELASVVDNLFCPAMQDYVGCKISLAAQSKGKTKFDSLLRMSGQNAGRIYDVTQETYEALDEFRFFPNRKTNWNYLTSEIVSNYGFSGTYNQEIVACITGLDLEKIINKIYGTRTEEGIFQYQAVPVQIVANVNGEYVIQITQLDMRKLDDMRKSLGGPVLSAEFHRAR